MITLDFPAGAILDTDSALLELEWPDGTKRTETVGWDLVPEITITPSGIVIYAGEARPHRRLFVKAASGSIRIRSVEPADLVERSSFSSSMALSHQVDVWFREASHLQGKAPHQLIIKTDHPMQEAVSVHVLLMPAKPMENER